MAGRTISYRGRLAPSPTGYLHLGHARTFWIAQERAKDHAGALILRMEDLDAARCRPEFTSAVLEDLEWFGFQWQEGPNIGGPCAPYVQSQRKQFYRQAFEYLKKTGAIYACTCSRQDVLRAAQAPNAGDDEPIYPGTCRGNRGSKGISTVPAPGPDEGAKDWPHGTRVNWRYRVPDGEIIQFRDGNLGLQAFTAGTDFGDFVVWRHDDVPSYQLAVVVDDAAMNITEVVRGADLLRSTARQILLYRALRLEQPAFYHCSLVTDANGVRLAKRHDALSLRQMRHGGNSPEQLKETMFARA